MCFERDASPPLVEHNIHRINWVVKYGLCHFADWSGGGERRRSIVSPYDIM